MATPFHLPVTAAQVLSLCYALKHGNRTVMLEDNYPIDVRFNINCENSTPSVPKRLSCPRNENKKKLNFFSMN